MGTLATAAPPIPPQIAAQQQQQQQQQSVVPILADMGRLGGGGIPDPIEILEQQMAKLEEWAGQTAPLLRQVNPALAALLVPIAQAGQALQQEIGDMKQRAGSPSSVVQGSNPPNVPGNQPSAQPAM